MWIFTVHGFFSIVKTNDGTGLMMIRARAEKHLINLMAAVGISSPILVQTGSDYAFRIKVPQDLWAEIATDLAKEVEWNNFKSEVSKRPTGERQGRAGYPYLDWLHRIWEGGFALQTIPARKEPAKKPVVADEYPHPDPRARGLREVYDSAPAKKPAKYSLDGTSPIGSTPDYTSNGPLDVRLTDEQTAELTVPTGSVPASTASSARSFFAKSA